MTESEIILHYLARRREAGALCRELGDEIGYSEAGMWRLLRRLESGGRPLGLYRTAVLEWCVREEVGVEKMDEAAVWLGCTSWGDDVVVEWLGRRIMEEKADIAEGV